MRIIHISVDLREASRGLLHTDVQLPVQPGTVATFTTPLWIQESDRNNGPLGGIAGLRFSSEGTTLPWRRNPKVASEYHVDIPPSVDTVHAVFEAVVTGKITRHMVMLGWESVLLYPAQRDVSKIPIQASVIVPVRWGIASALMNLSPIITPVADGRWKQMTWQPTSVERLADSPVLAGLHFGQFAVINDDRHILSVAADTEEYSVVPPEIIDKLTRLVKQTWAVFGARHYSRYWFLVALTDYWPTKFGGYEHHESCDVNLPRKALSDLENLARYGYTITHEFIHSWNGKYRRPESYFRHDFATPLDGRLLWVYDGLSSYYEGVISVRSGIMSVGDYRTEFAKRMAWLEGRSGRLWRSTEDTGTFLGSSLRPATAWANWLRGGQDYYYEGMLIWLDVDTLIRSKTAGRRSLDDFTRDFFGQGEITGPKVIPYNLSDIVSALNDVVVYDWQGLFQRKVLDVSPQINAEGLERSGYRFIYTDQPEDSQNTERDLKDALWNSIGVRFGENGELEDVKRGGPADVAKLAPRLAVVKVEESPFSLDALAREVGRKKCDFANPIRLTVTQEDEEWEVELDYHGGLRYPRLEHRTAVPDMLSIILAEKAPSL